LCDVGGSVPDVVGLEADVSLRILTEFGAEAEIVRLQDWSSGSDSDSDSETSAGRVFRVVCQRVSDEGHVILLVAPDLYRR
jgi:hypothetical protein